MEKIKSQIERMQEVVNKMDEYADMEKQYKDLQIEDLGKFMREVSKLVNYFDDLSYYVRNDVK